MVVMHIKKEHESNLLDALRKWGLEAQLAMVQEECAELIVAISHLYRQRLQLDDLAEETADVYCMLRQLELVIGEDKIQKVIDSKMERLHQRLELGKERTT